MVTWYTDNQGNCKCTFGFICMWSLKRRVLSLFRDKSEISVSLLTYEIGHVMCSMKGAVFWFLHSKLTSRFNLPQSKRKLSKPLYDIIKKRQGTPGGSGTVWDVLRHGELHPETHAWWAWVGPGAKESILQQSSFKPRTGRDPRWAQGECMVTCRGAVRRLAP